MPVFAPLHSSIQEGDKYLLNIDVVGRVMEVVMEFKIRTWRAPTLPLLNNFPQLCIIQLGGVQTQVPKRLGGGEQ